MPINLKLQDGFGHLAFNTDKSPAAAELVGWIDFVVDPGNDDERARYGLKAWIKRGRESASWYALSGLGYTGALRKRTDESSDDGPDYVGHFGPLQAFAWICADNDGKGYLRVEAHEPFVPLEPTSPGDDDSVKSGPDIAPLAF